MQQNPIPATQEMLSGLAEEKLSQWQLSREKQYIILSSDTKPSEVTKAAARPIDGWISTEFQVDFPKFQASFVVEGVPKGDIQSSLKLVAGPSRIREDLAHSVPGEAQFKHFRKGVRHHLSDLYGDGSKPWYLVNPKIASKWMFIPLKMYL